jgi:hypothetical protein
MTSYLFPEEKKKKKKICYNTGKKYKINYLKTI